MATRRVRRSTRSHPRPRRIQRAIQAAVALGVVAGVFLYLIPKFASYSAVWNVVRGLTAGQLGLLFATTALNIATYWPQMVAAMPGLTLLQAAVNNQASTAIASTMPGGGALGVAVAYRMFRQWGFDNTAIGLMALVTGIWNAFLKFGMPLAALAILSFTGDVTKGLLVAAVVGLASLAVSITVLVLILWKESLARRIGSFAGRAVSAARRIFHKPPVTRWDSAAARFRQRTIGLARRRWLALTVTTVASHVGLYLVFLVALRELGVSAGQVTWPEALGVFAFARLAAAVPITPGGAGVIEATYIGGLVLAGGSHANVVAAVLVFRALTWGLQIPLGPVAYLIYLRATSWRKGSATKPAHVMGKRPRRTPARAGA